jgi:ArsR family transcriptional regulator, cadmium/lead-responsive transcriptional repressor
VTYVRPSGQPAAAAGDGTAPVLDRWRLEPAVVFSLIAAIQRRLYSSGMAVPTELDLGALARIGMALADATRRRVLVHLIGGTGYPAQMAEQFGTTRANLSNHLACLRECGLVTATAEGRRVRYALADDRLADGLRILAALDLPGGHA